MAKKGPLIAAHRGVGGGNIPCNTLAAFETALRQGADIIELDVALSADGGHYVFHPGMEPAHLRSTRYISDMSAAEVGALRFVNQDGTPTAHRVSTLDEALDFLKGRCLINVDKFWTDVKGIAAITRAHGMADQVIVKTPPKQAMLEAIGEYAGDMPYMTVISGNDDCSERLQADRRIRYMGAEVLFASDSERLASREYVEWAHGLGLRLWVNSILYDYRVELAGGHSDDASLTGSPDIGWGWLIDRGFDIIQTDWPGMLRDYIVARG